MVTCIVLVLLVLAFLAGNVPLHYALMHHNAIDGNGCVVCLFVHGQVALTDINPVVVPRVDGLFVRLLPVGTATPWEVELFLPPGRAPPLTSSIS